MRLINKHREIIQKIFLNICLIYLAYRVIISNSIYALKSNLTLYFLAFFIALLFAKNSIIRTKLYLILGAIFLGMLQTLDYSLMNNIIHIDATKLFAISSIFACGPFKLIKDEESEQNLEIITVLTPYFLFASYLTMPYDLELIYIYSFLTLFSNSISVISRQKHILSSIFAESFSVYMILLNSLGPSYGINIMKIYMILLPANIIYLFISSSKIDDQYKKLSAYILALLPLISHQSFLEYIIGFYLIFVLTFRKYLVEMQDKFVIDLEYLGDVFSNFAFNKVNIPKLNFAIKLPLHRVSFTIVIFFIIIAFITYL